MNPTPIKPQRSLLIAALLFCATAVVPAATVRWTNPGTGDFGTGANWSNGSGPAPNDMATVTNGGTVVIADGLTYTISNLWVGARNFNNATGTVQITSGKLSLTGGPGQIANNPFVGVGVNALGRIEVAGGTLERVSSNPANPGYILVGGGGGRGFLNITSGNAFLDFMRIGSDQSGVPSSTASGTGTVNVSGGLLIVTNQWVIGRDSDVGIMNVTGGEVISAAVNFLTGVSGGSDDFLTLAAGQVSTGIVTVATGGTMRADGGIRISQASDIGVVADGTLRLTGGRLITQRIFQGATTGIGMPKIELDGGILEAANATNSSGFIYILSTSASSSNLIVRLKSGGVTIDSAGYDLLVTPAVLEDTGSPGGGIIKSNAGTLKLFGANTYKGATLIEGGGLTLATASTGGGAVTANDGSGFGAAISSAGSSLRLSSLTLNAGAGTNALNFDLGVLGNPTAPAMVATNLTVNRTNKVNLSGAGLSIGQCTLVQYTSAPGLSSNQFELNSLPVGITGQLVFEPNLIKLDITGAPSLHWNGNLSPDWDTNTTANWLDFSTPIPTATVYNDGTAVQFDDAATTNFVNLVYSLSPAAVTVTNQVANYVFSGAGFISGATGLRKQGSATLTLSTSNTYSGNTTISAGTLQLGASEVIPHGTGKGSVVVDGTLDLNGFSETINGLTGAGTIDNTTANACTLTAGNSGIAGNFGGVLSNSGGGPLALTKTGNNVLILSGNNGYTGGTRINAGFLQVGGSDVLGSGIVTLNGGTLSSDASTARTVTNAWAVTTGSTLGSPLANGFLTLSGPLDLSAGLRNLTVDSAALLTGGSGNGALNKLGLATLTLQGAHNWNDEVEVRNGTLIFDGAGVTNSAGIRANCDQPNGTARLVIGSGSFYVLTGNSNLRVGATGGNTTATNVVDIAGTVLIPNASTSNGRIILGQGTTIAFANLLTNAIAVVRGVSPANAPGYNEFNFNGGALQAVADNTTFMEGLTNAFVRAGGAMIDSAEFNITIAQNLLNGGGGGLTKIGAGALNLNGINTYTGSTIVSNGAVGGIGTIAGPVLVTSGGTFAPGNSVGTLTVNNTLTLQGTTLMEISRDGGAPASDLAAGISTLTYGGSLAVTNIGITALRSGDVFNLFDAATTIGSFAPVSLPPLLPGLSWNTSNLGANGTINITGTVVPPQFNAPVVSGTDLSLSGTGGIAGGTYHLLTSTDVALAVSNWTPIATNVFDGSGNFTFTETFDPGTPQRFYLIAIP